MKMNLKEHKFTFLPILIRKLSEHVSLTF